MVEKTDDLNFGSLEHLNRQEVDFLKFFKSNKSLVFVIGLILVAAVVASVVYFSYSKNKASESLEKIYAFQTTSLKDFNEGKIAQDVIVKDFSVLLNSVDRPERLLNQFELIVSKFSPTDIAAKQQFVAAFWNKGIKNNIVKSLVGMQYAAILEDSKEYKTAIEILTKIAPLNENPKPALTYLNLGRVYNLSGDATNAKTQFEYVVKNYKDTEEAKIASLYTK